MTKQRKKFNEYSYQIWALYKDQTEDLIDSFKYAKAADRHCKIMNDNPEYEGIVFEIRKVYNEVL
jgi:hypothetical protein